MIKGKGKRGKRTREKENGKREKEKDNKNKMIIIIMESSSACCTEAIELDPGAEGEAGLRGPPPHGRDGDAGRVVQ